MPLNQEMVCHLKENALNLYGCMEITMAGLDIDTLNTELKVKTCIFTCRYSSVMGRLIEVYFRSWCHYELRDMLLICLV